MKNDTIFKEKQKNFMVHRNVGNLGTLVKKDEEKSFIHDAQ
jgi:hypothetical protein